MPLDASMPLAPYARRFHTPDHRKDLSHGSTHRFYIGGRSSLTATHDGGRSWTAEPGFSGDASGTAEVTFVGADDGWAIDEGFGGHAVLWRTRDGGTHWTRLTTPATH